MNSPFTIKCNNCNIQYEINYDNPEKVATTYVICPKCKKKVYAASDFGFGLVWPAYMYYGNHLFFIISFSPDNQYQIKDRFHLNKEIILPKKYVSDNYNYHFEILEYIHKNIKEFMDTKDAKID